MGLRRKMSYILRPLFDNERDQIGPAYFEFNDACREAQKLSRDYTFVTVYLDDEPLMFYMKGKFFGYGPNTLSHDTIYLPQKKVLEIIALQDDSSLEGDSDHYVAAVRVKINRDYIRISSVENSNVYINVEIAGKNWDVAYGDTSAIGFTRMTVYENIKKRIQGG